MLVRKKISELVSLVYFKQVRIHIVIPQVGTIFFGSFVMELSDDSIDKRQVEGLDLIFEILCLVGFDVVGKEIGGSMFIDIVLAVKFIDAFFFDSDSVLGVNGSEFWSSDLFTWLWSHVEMFFGDGLRNST